MLGKSIPAWVNRLANWGDAISGIIPTGGKQVEAQMDGPAIGIATTAQIVEQRQSNSLPAKEMCLSDSELIVVAQVESAVLKLLGGIPEHDPAAFSQTVLAMCWPYSCAKFSSTLVASMDSMSSFSLDGAAFSQLSCLCRSRLSLNPRPAER